MRTKRLRRSVSYLLRRSPIRSFTSASSAESQHDRQPVTTMVISLTSSLLLVGTATGLIHSYDIASHQLLRTISTHKGFSITHLTTMLKPPDLVGHVSLSLNVGSLADSRESLPGRPIVSFQRMRDPKQRDAHEVTMMLPSTKTVCEYVPRRGHSAELMLHIQKKPEAFFSYPEEEMLRDYSVFVQTPDTGTQASGLSLQSRVMELEGEVQKLREQLGKAKSINDTMWETVVRNVIVEGKGKSKEINDSMDVDEGGTGGERMRDR